MLDREDNLMTFMLPFSLVILSQDRKTRSRDEIRNKKWWEDGFKNCFTGRHLEIGISGNIVKIEKMC